MFQFNKCFNLLILFNSMILFFGISSGLGVKQVVTKLSNQVLSDLGDNGWVIVRTRRKRSQRRSMLHPQGDGPFHSIVMRMINGYRLVLWG